MSRFNINRIQKSPEEWSAIAFKQTTENNIQLGLKLATTSQIVAVAFVDGRNTNVLKQWKRSPILELIDLDQLNQLLKASPVNRAVFFGGNSRWWAMPELRNYSDIDRDNDKPTGDALSTKERQSLRTVAAAKLQPIEQTLIEKLEKTKYLTLEDFIVKEMGGRSLTATQKGDRSIGW